MISWKDKLIEVLRSTINHVINAIDHYHQLWYDEALNLATILNVEEKMPRIPQVSIYRDNPPAEIAILQIFSDVTDIK